MLLVFTLTHALLQLLKPLPQHRLLSHVDAPHAVPHAPQLLVSDEVSAQVPLQHESPLGHLFPHAPQLFVSVDSFTQAPLHSACPAAQLPQVPLMQEVPLAHAWPHVPQLLASVLRFLQLFPEQSVKPVAQLQLLPPLLQQAPLVQLPQPP